MSPPAGMGGPDEDLQRWAARNAPALRARAEAEAVAILRDALVSAARRDPEPSRDATSRPASSRPAPAPAREPHPHQPDELLWAYCVLRAADPCPPGMTGVYGERPVERIDAAGLTALVSRVPAAQFATEPLAANLNELAWLERVARGHEGVLEAALAHSTIVPLRMCTIYHSEDAVREMLEREHQSLARALHALDGRLEWGIKVLVDRGRLMEAARPADGEELATGEGGAYLQRRRTERATREAAGRLAADLGRQVHARLQDWAVDATTRPPQNRELSGHEGEMVLNGAYLVERERTDELRRLVSELQDHHRRLAVRIELTGPWAPYNFVPGDDATALA